MTSSDIRTLDLKALGLEKEVLKTVCIYIAHRKNYSPFVGARFGLILIFWVKSLATLPLIKTLIQGNEEGPDDYVETALDQHTLLKRTTVSLCMTHNPGGYERITN